MDMQHRYAARTCFMDIQKWMSSSRDMQYVLVAWKCSKDRKQGYAV
jgi:hypothetical protein